MNSIWMSQLLIKLPGQTLELIPLNESHFNQIMQIAEEKKIWEFNPNNLFIPEKLLQSLNASLVGRINFAEFPFVIYHKLDNKIIGCTKYINPNEKNKSIEIGATWLHPNYWGTHVNAEAKLLLLTYCFEVMKMVRVQFKTDENNIRSRKAIQKIGGQFEGTLRNDMLRYDNSKRNSSYYSITDDEWEEKKILLTTLSKSGI